MDLTKNENNDEVKELSIILPCFNEEDNVSRFESEVFAHFNRLALRCEYIIVDDGSTDQTFEKAQKLARSNPNIRILKHATNQGLGAALRTGFAAATGDAILTLDSDLTFDVQEADRLLKVYEPNVDCVSGSPIR